MSTLTTNSYDTVCPSNQEPDRAAQQLHFLLVDMHLTVHEKAIFWFVLTLLAHVTAYRHNSGGDAYSLMCFSVVFDEILSGLQKGLSHHLCTYPHSLRQSFLTKRKQERKKGKKQQPPFHLNVCKNGLKPCTSRHSLPPVEMQVWRWESS